MCVCACVRVCRESQHGSKSSFNPLVWIITRVSRLQRDRRGPDLSITHLYRLFLPQSARPYTLKHTQHFIPLSLFPPHYLSISHPSITFLLPRTHKEDLQSHTVARQVATALSSFPSFIHPSIQFFFFPLPSSLFFPLRSHASTPSDQQRNLGLLFLAGILHEHTQLETPHLTVQNRVSFVLFPVCDNGA